MIILITGSLEILLLSVADPDLQLRRGLRDYEC